MKFRLAHRRRANEVRKLREQLEDDEHIEFFATLAEEVRQERRNREVS